MGESVLTPTPFVLLVPIHTTSHNGAYPHSVGKMDYWIGTTTTTEEKTKQERSNVGAKRTGP